MTYRPKAARDSDAVDRAVDGRPPPRDRGRCGHGASCQCIVNIGQAAYAAETARLKAEHDAAGYASPPLGRWRKRI